MDRGSAQPDASAHPPAGPRRIPRPAAATRYHGFPDEAEDEGRADPGRGPHAAEPPPRDAVSRRLREPVPCGAATRRPAGPEADPSFEGETRRIPPNELNADRRFRAELTLPEGVIDQTKNAIPTARRVVKFVPTTKRDGLPVPIYRMNMDRTNPVMTLRPNRLARTQRPKE